MVGNKLQLIYSILNVKMKTFARKRVVRIINVDLNGKIKVIVKKLYILKVLVMDLWEW